MLLWHQTQPGREIPAAHKTLRRWCQCYHRRCANRTDSGDRHQPGCDIVLSCSFPDIPVKRIDPELELINLVHQHARKFDNFGRQIAVCAFYHRNEPTQMRNSCRGDDAVFGQIAAQSVDRLGLLPNEEIPRSKRHARRLLLNALHRNEPHRRPRGRFGDGFRIGAVVRRENDSQGTVEKVRICGFGCLSVDFSNSTYNILCHFLREIQYIALFQQPRPDHFPFRLTLTFDERLDVDRRYEAHLVTQVTDRPGPVMRTGASLHCNQTNRLLGEERQYLIARELLTKRNTSIGFGPVCLKHILRQIQADDDSLFHGRLLRRGFQHRNLGTLMPSGGGRPPHRLRSMQRVLPSIEFRLPACFSQSVHKKDVNWHLWKVFDLPRIAQIDGKSLS